MDGTKSGMTFLMMVVRHNGMCLNEHQAENHEPARESPHQAKVTFFGQAVMT